MMNASKILSSGSQPRLQMMFQTFCHIVSDCRDIASAKAFRISASQSSRIGVVQQRVKQMDDCITSALKREG